MPSVVEGVRGGKNGDLHGIGYGLDAQPAADHEDVLCPFRDLQRLFGLSPVAEEIRLQGACHGLSLILQHLYELIAVGLLNGLELLEALVAGEHEDVVGAVKIRSQLFRGFKAVPGIVKQFLTFFG